MNNPTRPEKHEEIAAAKATEAAKPLSGWDAISIGSVVLAQVDKAEGFFPAVVEKISTDGRTLTLRWKSYNLPPFTMRRLSVGLICKVG